MKLTKVKTGEYLTADGWRIAKDSGSRDEYDSASDPEWFLYRPGVRADFGPPDAVAEFETLRAAKRYLTDNGIN